MAVKAFLESLEGIPEPIAKEYKEVENDGKKSYVLDVEGAFIHTEDIGPLKRAKDHEKLGRQEAEKKHKEFQAKYEAAQAEIEQMRLGNIPKGDVDKLEKSWKERFETQKTNYDSQLQARDKTIQKHLVDSVARNMASQIVAIPESVDLILPHIQRRLGIEVVDGEFVTRILDKDGKASAIGLEDLQKEIIADKRFAPIIKGSKASGGGASGDGKPPGSGAPQFDLSKPFDWNKATPKMIAEYQRAKKAASGG